MVLTVTLSESPSESIPGLVSSLSVTHTNRCLQVSRARHSECFTAVAANRSALTGNATDARRHEGRLNHSTPLSCSVINALRLQDQRSWRGVPL